MLTFLTVRLLILLKGVGVVAHAPELDVDWLFSYRLGRHLTDRLDKCLRSLLEDHVLCGSPIRGDSSLTSQTPCSHGRIRETADVEAELPRGQHDGPATCQVARTYP